MTARCQHSSWHYDRFQLHLLNSFVRISNSSTCFKAMYIKCSNECCSLVPPVHTFTVRKLYATSKKSNSSVFQIYGESAKQIAFFKENGEDNFEFQWTTFWWAFHYQECSLNLNHFWSPVQTFTARTLHAFVYSNHPHFLCRSNVRRKFTRKAFSQELLFHGTDSCINAFLDMTNLTSSS